jgi:hypothetical protein
MTIFNYGMQLWSLKSLDPVLSYSFGRKMDGFVQKLALDVEEETRALACQILESLRVVKN